MWRPTTRRACHRTAAQNAIALWIRTRATPIPLHSPPRPNQHSRPIAWWSFPLLTRTITQLGILSPPPPPADTSRAEREEFIVVGWIPPLLLHEHVGNRRPCNADSHLQQRSDTTLQRFIGLKIQYQNTNTILRINVYKEGRPKCAFRCRFSSLY